MKYWFFNGEEILGPFTPQELAAQAGFSAASLICPESASTDSLLWKTAASFECFHFDEQTGKLEDITPCLEDSFSQKMPAGREPERFAAPADTAAAGAAPARPAAYRPAAQPAAEDKQGTALPEPLEPEPTTLVIEDESAYATQPPKGKKGRPEEKVHPRQAQEIDLAQVAAVPLSASDEAAQTSQVRPRLESTPEIEEFLTDQRTRSTPNRRRARKLLWLLAVLFVIGLIWLVLYSRMQLAAVKQSIMHRSALSVREEQPVALPSPATEEIAEVLEPAPAPAPAPAVTPAPAVALTPSDKALSAVQNYYLPEKQETILSYFDKLYQENLSQGYTASWAVEPLHKDTYIVKYRISKARQEPIMYVFQANAQKGQLTGALNNIALDLVGKL